MRTLALEAIANYAAVHFVTRRNSSIARPGGPDLQRNRRSSYHYFNAIVSWRFVCSGLAENRSKPDDIRAVACFPVVDRARFRTLQTHISQGVAKPTIAGLKRIDRGYDLVRLSYFAPVKNPGPPSGGDGVSTPQHKYQSNRCDSSNERILPTKN